MKAIFWDFDGTLVHRNNESFYALKEALQLNNYVIEDSEIQAALNWAHPWNHWETSYENETGEKWWNRLFSKLSGFYERYGVTEVDKVTVPTKSVFCRSPATRSLTMQQRSWNTAKIWDTVIILFPITIQSFPRRLRSLDWISSFPAI